MCVNVHVCVCLSEDMHTQQQYYRVSVVVLKHGVIFEFKETMVLQLLA